MVTKTMDKVITSSNRVDLLKTAIHDSIPSVCPERALLWTEYCQDPSNQNKPQALQIVEATRHVLRNMSISIYDNELIVGNYSSKRIGGIIYPELNGVGALGEIDSIRTRKVNRLNCSERERDELKGILDYWSTRCMTYRAFDAKTEREDMLARLSTAREFQIYEAAGLAHLAPDYAKLARIGTEGIIKEAEEYQSRTKDPEKLVFLKSTIIAAKALAAFGDRYSKLAGRLAERETDPGRKNELAKISNICKNVPRNGANTFYEAVQSVMLGHIALFQETKGETICPGRLDQIFYSFFEKDLERGLITRERAKELLAAFSIKLCETVPVHTDLGTKTLGGFPSYQVVTVGGVGPDGADATNELSFILLEIMDELRMRQPNFHVRISKKTPKDFYDAVIRVNCGNGSAPAMYNDEIIIETMQKYGYSLEDARDYVAIGCVEPTAPGKTLGSTDAATFNMPLVLELALNEGCQFDSSIRLGAKTPPAHDMASMADVLSAYEIQLLHQLNKMQHDLQALEVANAKLHPTPMTSMMIDGCMEKGVCSTRGGAQYNFSGVQGVGLTTVGDSLYAVEKAVFIDKSVTMKCLFDALAGNLEDRKLQTSLRCLGKFGNDNPEADKWTRYVGDCYSRAIDSLGLNTRGGQYIAGIYSNTTHVHFGSIVGALPNGRRSGEPFASGMAPENGMDKNGPTALLNSMNRMDFTKFSNGINFNVKFDSSSFRDDDGKKALRSIFDVYFERGGMQLQVNMLDPSVLVEARDNPDAHPNLLVRISGYSAYFNDLSPEMKQELISRSSNSV